MKHFYYQAFFKRIVTFFNQYMYKIQLKYTEILYDSILNLSLPSIFKNINEMHLEEYNLLFIYVMRTFNITQHQFSVKLMA